MLDFLWVGGGESEVSLKAEVIDQKAVVAAARYKKCEFELIEILETAETFRVPTSLGYNSLFAYATERLGLSEDVSYIFIKVARKVREVPALREEIRSGRVSVCKAKRISAVLNRENQKHWLGVAASSSKRDLEKLVAAENPKASVIEKSVYVSRDRLDLRVGVSEKFILEVRRAQDNLSQKRRRPVSLEETLEVAVSLLNSKIDPVEKANRQMARGKLCDLPIAGQQVSHTRGTERPGVDNLPGSDGPTVDNLTAQLGPDPVEQSCVTNLPVRRPIPASTRHRLNIKFQGQCGFVDQKGERCAQRRFLDIHHIKPVSVGGSNNIDNLELLCTGHHRFRHS